MIIKSLLLLSIFFGQIGLTGLESKFDQSVVRNQYADNSLVYASTDLPPLPSIAPHPRINFGAPRPLIKAKNFILADGESGTVLAKQAAYDKVPIASTTKIMTAIIVLENYDLNEIVTVSETASKQIGATANFIAGERITVRNLLKALLVKSANGAAYALAEHMNSAGESGTARFVKAMNSKALELGMTNTDYHDPAGLDVTGYSTAYDLFLVTKYALKNKVFQEIVQIKETSITDVTGEIWHQLSNSNRLVNEWGYAGAIGVKTGYMPEAGHCLVAAARRDGHTLISVVLSTYADTPTASAEESRDLLDWGFANVKWE